MLALVTIGNAYAPTGMPAPVAAGAAAAAVARAGPAVMDETILQKALAGELEAEGAEQHWLSEAGWAVWLDENAESSYNLNQRPSKAEDGYFTPDVFSNPIAGESTMNKPADALFSETRACVLLRVIQCMSVL